MIVGAAVSTREIFAKCFAKFNTRLRAYAGFLKTCSLHTRIMVANVFLIPLMTYLMEFYICPYDSVVKPVQRALHQMIVPYRGTGFAYAHLVTSRDSGGPMVPLRDIWCTNIAILAAIHNLEESDGLLTPAMGVKGHRLWHLTQYKGRAMDKCMTTEGHAAYAAFHALEDYAPRRHNAIITLEDLPGPGQGTKRRRFIYRRLAEHAYKQARSDPLKPTSLDAKIGRFCPQPDLGRLFRAQAAVVARRLTPAVWNTQIRLMMNALPFDCRRDSACMSSSPRPCAGCDSLFPCYFCGKGEDSTAHVYGRCSVVREARNGLARALGCKIPSNMRSTMLAIPVHSNPAVAMAIVCFNWAVWTERSQYLPTLGCTPSRQHVVRRIVMRAQLRMPVGKKPPGKRQEGAVAAFARDPPPTQRWDSRMAPPSPTLGPAARGSWSASSVIACTRRSPSPLAMATTTRVRWEPSSASCGRASQHSRPAALWKGRSSWSSPIRPSVLAS